MVVVVLLVLGCCLGAVLVLGWDGLVVLFAGFDVLCYGCGGL